MKVWAVRVYLEDANDDLDSIWDTEAGALKRVDELTEEWLFNGSGLPISEIWDGVSYAEMELNKAGG